MNRRALALACLMFAPSLACAGAPELIGQTMPPYPDGLRDVGGTCLSDGSPGAAICDYSIGMLGRENEDPSLEPSISYVVAGRLAGRDGPLAVWKITDAKPYPKAARGYYWQAGGCRVDRQQDANIVAVVRAGLDGEYLTDVIWAQRLDLGTGRFTALEPSHVDCINEGYGEGP